MRADSLEANLGAAPVVAQVKTVIHDVDILDASGSMGGSKYTNSILSINKGIELLLTDTAVEYRKTIVEFNGNRGVVKHKVARSLSEANFKPIGAAGLTPLYETIGTVLTELRSIVKDEDRVLIKIFTDGQDTGFHLWSPDRVKNLIDELKSIGWTITFNGTAGDIDYVVNHISIDRSNTLAHDNTASGIMMMANMRSSATMSYSKAVAEGVSKDELVKNFYTKTVNTQQ